jgi:multidrug efflux pump subunit AcrB
MNFATWSIQNPIPSILLFILLTLAGIHGFNNLIIRDLPDISFPQVEVSLSLPGATPSQLETEVARKAEDAIVSIVGVKDLSTSITEGNVSIGISFDLEKNLSDALTETKDALDRIRADLPTDLEAPNVSAIRIDGDPLITYSISSSKLDEKSLSWFVDDTVGRLFRSINGVGKFSRVGGVNREVRIEVDPIKLAALNVTAADISKALKEVQVEASAGRGYIGHSEQAIKTIATVSRAEDLNALPIALPDGRRIQLDQVATIYDTEAKRTEAALVNGKETVVFEVYGSKEADEVQIGEDAAQIIETLREQYPDLTITPIVNSITYTLEQFDGSMHMLYEGAILAVLVVGFFLRDWRATLIAATALPLSIIPTFGIMYWLGFSLNTLSLLALAVVVGILIDDAIVEIENIVRHKRMGKTILQATKDAVNEIALAVIAITLTIVMVFLPTSLMGGVIGLLFRQFGWTVVISVLMSLAVARLLTPLMAAYFLKGGSNHLHDKKDGIAMTSYLGAVRWCLAHKRKTLLLATTFFGLSLFLATKLPEGFIPPSDMGFTNLTVELPPGSTLDDTLETTERVRKRLEKIEGIDNLFTVAGAAGENEEGGESVGALRKASMVITFLPKDERSPQSVIDREIRKALPDIPGAKFTLKNDGPGENFSISLSGQNMEALTRTAAEMEKALRGLKSISNVNSTASLYRPEINIRPDYARAAELGITTESIAETIRIATSGDFNPRLSKLNLDNRQIYIRVQMADSLLQDMDTIANLRIPGKLGHTTLGNIASITTDTGPAQIDRHNRERFVTISADLGGTPLGQALDEAMALPAMKDKPSSIKFLEMDDEEMMEDLFSGFGLAMIFGILCVFCVLVLLFKDFFQPITILSALPLSFGGSIIALLIAGAQMGLPALIGIIMLMGIVTKNSILLVEYTIIGMQERGLSRFDAIIDACHKRARPIIMTTIAMIAGMTPIALGMGGDTFRQPMAIAVIGGLITSTFLSLLVVPVIFTYINMAELWVAKRIKNIHILSEDEGSKNART